MREKIRTMDPQKRKKAVILASVLAVLLALGATLAYLSAITDQKENAFSFADNIRGKLTEPNWDPGLAENLVPGAQVPKDPMVTNTSSNGVSEWAAVRVNFTDGEGNMLSDDPADDDWVGRLLRMLDIDWNTVDWALADPDMADAAEQVWVYQHELAPGEVTTPLFSSVTIRTKDMMEGPLPAGFDWDEEYAWLSGFTMTHTDACDLFENPCTCTDPKTWRHHTMCAIYEMAGADAVGPGGMLGTEACDCMPVQVHDADCLYNVSSGTDPDCGCEPPDTIGGFYIVLRAAVVQSMVDGMDAPDDQATIDALLALFEANPYDGLTS
ncbi:MAG: hypothetical protein FWG23_04725 [Eggerthellaceae bacterium]|nr:hypothetical protein [Eggerthellaceae bacterium]